MQEKDRKVQCLVPGLYVRFTKKVKTATYSEYCLTLACFLLYSILTNVLLETVIMLINLKLI